MIFEVVDDAINDEKIFLHISGYGREILEQLDLKVGVLDCKMLLGSFRCMFLGCN